jgi:hypothetical protein
VWRVRDAESFQTASVLPALPPRPAQEKKAGRMRVRQEDTVWEVFAAWLSQCACWHTLFEPFAACCLLSCVIQSDGHQREELLSKFRDAGSSVKTIFMSSVSVSCPLCSKELLLFPSCCPRHPSFHVHPFMSSLFLFFLPRVPLPHFHPGGGALC